MSAIYSTVAIKAELESTIQQSQSSLDAYCENASEFAHLEEAQDYVRQLYGIFQILEESAVVFFCDEMNACLLALPVGSDPKELPNRAILESVSQGLVILSRYLELISLKGKVVPAVLFLPSVNQMRVARGATMLGEGSFFEFSFKPSKPVSSQKTKITRDSIEQLKKYRHMYQAALLHMIKGDRTVGAMRYMALALSRIDQLLGSMPSAPLWWVASGALEALIQNNAVISPTRKRLFSLLDRELKKLIQRAPSSIKQASNTRLMKEFLYLIAINKSDSLKARQIAKFYNIPDLEYSEKLLEEQRQVLFSPGLGVIESVAEALKDDIDAIKSSVDSVARGGSFSSNDLGARLTKVADVYIMLGLQSPANVLKNQAKIVTGWPDNAVPEHDKLLSIADVVLYAESALSRLLQGQSQLDQEGDNKTFKAQVYDARVALIDESENGLALAKRSISSFIDSNGDKLHLANVVSTLNGVRGALIFLDSVKAAELVAKATSFVERELLGQAKVTLGNNLELFADALSSLEFYLEGLLSGNDNMDILKLAVHSLNSLEG